MAVGNGTRLMTGLEDLSKVILGKDDRVILIRRVQRGIAHIQQIGSQRQMRTMLFENAEWQQACALGTLGGTMKSAPVSSSQCTDRVCSVACAGPIAAKP